MFSPITDEEALRRLPLSEEQRKEFYRLVRLEEEKAKESPMAVVPAAMPSVETACPAPKGPEFECEEPRP